MPKQSNKKNSSMPTSPATGSGQTEVVVEKFTCCKCGHKRNKPGQITLTMSEELQKECSLKPVYLLCWGCVIQTLNLP